MLASAIFFSAASVKKILNLLNFMSIETMKTSTYYALQKLYIIPAVSRLWHRQQAKLLNELPSAGANIAGDARCCSPGHTAKYGSYSFISLDTGKVIDIQLVQVCIYLVTFT